ncbi:hypothetical protein [Reyranella sp. CPCC 100927]|uniref:hypothetical protein n=1 Tax=Reyranella sp. CPCC 100927 TaxID=2599616 RepID=UPI0011B7083D|nr:hypothetical protein [Reyranella sp. CPCC 100927]TWT13715.1 hypothetical protein FQU96_07300 [Reyranella sp. CPCC 100927]
MPFDPSARSDNASLLARSKALCRESAELCRHSHILIKTIRREQRARDRPELWSLYYDEPLPKRPGHEPENSN